MEVAGKSNRFVVVSRQRPDKIGYLTGEERTDVVGTTVKPKQFEIRFDDGETKWMQKRSFQILFSSSDTTISTVEDSTTQTCGENSISMFVKTHSIESKIYHVQNYEMINLQNLSSQLPIKSKMVYMRKKMDYHSAVFTNGPIN